MTHHQATPTDICLVVPVINGAAGIAAGTSPEVPAKLEIGD